MRILHFYKTYKPDSQGGVEQFIWELCTGAAAQGIESDVLTVSKTRGTTDFGHHRHYRARQDLKIASSSFSLSAFGQFRQLAARADIVHYHFPWPFADMVHFCTQLKKPTVVTYHSDIVKQQRLLRLYRPLMQRFLASVDCIVATSPNYIETSTVLTAYREKTVVIPLGLDKAAYPAASVTRLAQWRACLPDGFFLFVGNLRYYKGLHHLLEALRGTTYPMVIVGAGPEESALRQQAAALKLTHVHFVGAVADEDKIALLTLCKALVFPSHLRSEAFGLSLLEGAMFEKALLSCELGTGTSYVNIAGETGLVVPAADPQALRDGIAWLATHPVEAAAMGKQSGARYQRLFTSAVMVDRYAALYRRLLA
ncbi:glycosyltransferase [Robbsia sp. Bb-Pol-6]|uniref:Glycosyltransferase n=1 Tax=Robbsia betulipollinis TaxID=2981849 RepID=A0ABT3ZM16_9BURK|nr:glycosyltransferase [Robbsia betulipollinis]MCY0387565.1 glycosyltransferase [Robbsia betulipollinis]